MRYCLGLDVEKLEVAVDAGAAHSGLAGDVSDGVPPVAVFVEVVDQQFDGFDEGIGLDGGSPWPFSVFFGGVNAAADALGAAGGVDVVDGCDGAEEDAIGVVVGVEFVVQDVQVGAEVFDLGNTCDQVGAVVSEAVEAGDGESVAGA